MNIETLAAKYSAIPPHWVLSTLGESLSGIIGGGTPSRDNPSFWGGDIPWLTVKDMRGRRPTDAQEHITQQAVKDSATNIIPPDTVIIASRVGLGKVVRVPFAAAINQDLKALVVGPDLDKSYLEYWLVSIATFLESIGSGTTVKGIRLETLRQLPIPLAPLHEQREIVAELEKQFSRLDEAVANLQRVKANLKRYKASVLKAAVEGRLVETEASLARRESRTCETGEQLLLRILEERRAKWAGKGKYKEPVKADGMGAVPEGWTNASLDMLSTDSGYGTSQKCGYENYGPVVLRIPNVQHGVLDLHDLKFAPTEFKLSQSDAVSAGDMLIIRTNGSKSLIGRAAVVMAGPQRKMSFASYLIRFRLSSADCISAWVSVVWQTSQMRQWIEAHAATSAGQHNVSMTVLAKANIPVPPVAEQARIVAEVDRHLSIIREVEAEVDTNLKRAQALRQSTLAKAFGIQSTQSEH